MTMTCLTHEILDLRYYEEYRSYPCGNSTPNDRLELGPRPVGRNPLQILWNLKLWSCSATRKHFTTWSIRFLRLKKRIPEEISLRAMNTRLSVRFVSPSPGRREGSNNWFHTHCALKFDVIRIVRLKMKINGNDMTVKKREGCRSFSTAFQISRVTHVTSWYVS